MKKIKFITISLCFFFIVALFMPKFSAKADSITQPTIQEVTIISKTSMKIHWNKIKSADGYMLYRKDHENDWSKIATIKNPGRTYYDDNDLTYGQTYCYKIIAYTYDNTTYSIDSLIDFNDENSYEMTLSYSSQYKGKYKLFYDSKGNLIKDVDQIIGHKKSYFIKVNTKQCVVTIYTKDKKKGYFIPVKAYLCSPNNYTSTGTFDTKDKYRYRSLFYSSYSQWTVQIHGNILFHTTPYKKYHNKLSLDPKEYNKLGTAASHGCVRMPCEGVKFIYDRCKRGTKVVIYRSNNPGPLGKPKLSKIPSWHTWDPTDPTCEKRCQKYKCH